MGQTFEIDGSTYTEEELIDILREQIPGLEKYSQYEEDFVLDNVNTLGLAAIVSLNERALDGNASVDNE